MSFALGLFILDNEFSCSGILFIDTKSWSMVQTGPDRMTVGWPLLMS